jgi:hypothetical protein
VVLGRGHCVPTTFTEGTSGKGANMCFKSVVLPKKPTMSWLKKLHETMGKKKPDPKYAFQFQEKPNAYDWGVQVIKFFKANPCQ